MVAAQTTQMTLPNKRGVTRYIHPMLVIFAPPLMKMREAAPAGGWDTPHTCMAAIDVAGASATATQLGMALAYCGADA